MKKLVFFSAIVITMIVSSCKSCDCPGNGGFKKNAAIEVPQTNSQLKVS